MPDNDYEIYTGKNFSDLCKDIVKNSEDKRNQLDILTTDLREMVKTLAEAITIIPLLKEYLDVGIKNDEQLIKLAAIIQRLIAGKTESADGGFILSDEEKKQLMGEIEATAKASNDIVVEEKKVSTKKDS